MGRMTTVDVNAAWVGDGVKLAPVPESWPTAAEAGWSTGGPFARPPGLLLDRLTKLIRDAESNGVIVRLWIDGELVTDLHHAYLMRTVEILGLNDKAA